MSTGLEPAFSTGRVPWPLAGLPGMAPEPDDPDLAIPQGALENGPREARETAGLVDASPRLADLPAAPLAGALTRPPASGRKWTASVVMSCVFHAALALFFVTAGSDAVLMEGAELSGIAILGNAPEDQLSEGQRADPDATMVTMITMMEADAVETVTAEAVAVERDAEVVEAVEPEQVQPADPAQTVQSSEVERVEPVDAEPQQAALPEVAPQVLALDRQASVDDRNVVAPTVESTPTETVEAQAVEPVEEQAVEPVEEAAPKKPVEKKVAKPEKTVAAKKATEKPVRKAEKPAKKPEARAKAGNGGRSKSDAARGQADGDAKGTATARSRGGKGSAVGNAAVSNYPGKVASKLRRALRYPAEAKRQKLRGEVQVSFVVSAGGGVGSIRVVRSSGSPILDRAAIDTVKRAAPFPAIPDGAGRSSWPFTVPLAFAR